MKTDSAASTYYRHRQHAPLCLLIYVPAVVLLVTSLTRPPEFPINVVLLASSGLLFALGAAFHHLTVEDLGEQLLIRFGPLPLFARRINIAEIESVAVGRTTILDGWGIHKSLRGGWVWNLWGRDCVELELRRGILRVGTDQPEQLASYLSQHIVPKQPVNSFNSPTH
jgi:hypothetical protein